jgi:hypothetical protein
MHGAVSKVTEERRARLSHTRRRKRHVPVTRLNGPRKALQWLFPWPEYGYPGQWKGFSAVLGSSVESMRHWLAGRRTMPEAVRLRLIEAIRARLESGAAVLAELEAYTPPSKPPPAFRREAARRNEEAGKLGDI